MTGLLSVAGSTPSDGYEIEQSLKFNRPSNDILSRTPTFLGNRRTWTLSTWVKRGVLDAGLQTIFGTQETGAAGGAGEDMGRMAWDADNQITYHSDNDGTFNLQSTPTFCDPSGWYHLVIVCDTTQDTDTNRLKFYINGTQITAFVTANWPSQNLNTPYNYPHVHRVGASYGDTAETFDGYLAEFHWIDGGQLTPASFGETDEDTGQWKPIEYDGSVVSTYISGDRTPNVTVTTAGLSLGVSGTIANFVNDNFGEDTTNSWYFSNDYDPVGGHVKFDFGSAVTNTDAKWCQSGTNSHGTWKWQGSNDDSSWTDIGSSFTLGGSKMQQQTQLNGNAIAYRYYRLLGLSGTTSSSPYLQEIIFADTSLPGYGTNGFYQKYASTELAATITDSGSSSHSFSSQTGGIGNTLSARSRHGIYEWTAPVGVSSIEILVVGGGGGTGGSAGGGGGGGVCYSASHSVTAGNTYRIQVGQGGGQAWSTGHVANWQYGGYGQNSTFSGTGTSTITALGGGSGMYGGGDGSNIDGDGGSGGGAGRSDASATGGTGDQADSGGATGYGNNGGNNHTSSPYNGGGGGGAGAAGSNAPSGSTGGGDGGDGQAFTIADGSTSIYYGGGGGGAGTGAVASGGLGGGGDGSNDGTTAAYPGIDGLGGGAGGGGTAGGLFKNGAKGGDGIVIINDGTTRTSFEVADTSLGDSSISWNGTDQKLAIASSADWNFGTGNFTIESWIRAPRVQRTYADQIVLMDHNHAGTTGWRTRLGMTYVGGSTGYVRNFWFGANGHAGLKTTAVFTDNCWHHVAVVRSGTGTDETKIYVDGIEDASGTFATDFSITAALELGVISGDTSWFLGYQTEIRISNTARYSATFIPQTTRFVSDSNTKLLIHSTYNGGLGGDSSGRNNYYTPTNVAVQDQMLDSPTNNFATLNPSIKTYGTITLSEGNLKTVGDGNWNAVASTQLIESDKWYWETLCGGTNIQFGLWPHNANLSIQNSQEYSGNLYYGSDGAVRTDGTFVSYGDSFGSGDIIGTAVDADAKTITWYKNNVSQGAYSFSGSVSSATAWIVGGVFLSQTDYWNFGQDSSFVGQKTAQGNGGIGEDFYYTPPAGYKALNSNNYNEPSIVLPGEHFNTVLYTGNGSTQSITGVGFQPDIVWIKDRTTTESPHLYDAVRGATETLLTNQTQAEFTGADRLTAFNSDGFSLGSNDGVNKNTDNIVSWNWKANGAGSSNTDGSITTTVSANVAAGFSIIKFTGNGTAGATIGHGLSAAPEFWVTKNLVEAYQWGTGSEYYPSPAGNYYGAWQSEDQANSNTGIWNGTLPSSSVITLGNLAGFQNENGDEHICYAFHSVEGFSRIGTYTGNGNAKGPVFYTGFRPAYVWTKKTTGSGPWIIYDDKRVGYNGGNYWLQIQVNTAENTAEHLDILSNGIQIKRTHADQNTSGATYLVMAFAEFPFKYAPAR